MSNYYKDFSIFNSRFKPLLVKNSLKEPFLSESCSIPLIDQKKLSLFPFHRLPRETQFQVLDFLDLDTLTNFQKNEVYFTGFHLNQIYQKFLYMEKYPIAIKRSMQFYHGSLKVVFYKRLDLRKENYQVKELPKLAKYNLNEQVVYFSVEQKRLNIRQAYLLNEQQKNDLKNFYTIPVPHQYKTAAFKITLLCFMEVIISIVGFGFVDKACPDSNHYPGSMCQWGKPFLTVALVINSLTLFTCGGIFGGFCYVTRNGIPLPNAVFPDTMPLDADDLLEEQV